MKKNYPKKVKIVEVGPRDGLQNEVDIVPLDVKQQFIHKLSESGLKDIEIGAFVRADRVPQMADSEELIKSILSSSNYTDELKEKFSALTPNMKGLERALESGVKRIAVFTAASESFTKKNINMSIEESLDAFAPVIKKALVEGMTVRGYLSTCFVCPYEGEVSYDKVVELCKALVDLGVDEISLGDTIGAASPNNVFDLLDTLSREMDLDRIALHFHDTYGTALANVKAGLDMGVKIFDSSAAGLGGCPYAPGASGNLATEDLVYMLNRMGIDTGVDLEKLAQAGKLMQDHLGRKLPSKNLQRLIT